MLPVATKCGLGVVEGVAETVADVVGDEGPAVIAGLLGGTVGLSSSLPQPARMASTIATATERPTSCLDRLEQPRH
jgi:hypothetical protein